LGLDIECGVDLGYLARIQPDELTGLSKNSFTVFILCKGPVRWRDHMVVGGLDEED
jgi:hypothetical protein